MYLGDGVDEIVDLILDFKLVCCGLVWFVEEEKGYLCLNKKFLLYEFFIYFGFC